MTPILPVDYWRNENDFPATREKKKPYQYVSLDRSIFIPAGEDFVTGSLYYGSKIHDVLLAFGLAPAPANRRLYITDENQENTYSAAVGDDGSFTDVKLFAEIGGESVAEDVEGNVSPANGLVPSKCRSVLRKFCSAVQTAKPCSSRRAVRCTPCKCAMPAVKDTLLLFPLHSTMHLTAGADPRARPCA